jgi:hypothetical protein
MVASSCPEVDVPEFKHMSVCGIKHNIGRERNCYGITRHMSYFDVTQYAERTSNSFLVRMQNDVCMTYVDLNCKQNRNEQNLFTMH